MLNPDTATGRLDPAARSGTAAPWAWRERYETIAAVTGMVGVVLSGATAVTLLGLLTGSAAAWCGLAIMPVVVFTAWYPVLLLGPPLSVLAASVALLVCDRAVSRMK
ncbi:hypothetical protein ACNQR7_30975 [Mycolicibacterium senegalense]|uniref:hypothetical protein n=1 Tax=Mycolicibacterium senegalense TaxID=1796 RepID=UPI003AAE9A8B